jgi:sugar lactone lactonase YvrE
VDLKGNVYIAESWGNRIRKVDAATSIITTFAGRGLPSNFSGDGGLALDAVFRLPAGIVTDGIGNLYIADEGNFRIRKVDAATGIITTYAGNGIEGYSGDGGPAVNASMSTPHALAVDRNDNIYFVDKKNNRIRKITKATGMITTVAGNGSTTFSGDGGPANNASFEGLSGVAVDSEGNIYLADVSSRVRKVNQSTGIITTVAGNGLQEYAGDGGPATAASFGLDKIVGSATIAVDTNNNLYILDGRNGRIRKVNPSTGIITTVVGHGVFGFSGDGGSAIAAKLGSMSSVSVDCKGNIYINDQNRSIIRRVDAVTGIITTLAGNRTNSYLGDGKKAKEVAIGPTKLAFDDSDNLVIAEGNGSRIRRIDAATSVVTTVAGSGQGFSFSGDGLPATEASVSVPNGIALDKEGNLYLIDWQRRIRKVSAATRIISHFAGDSTQMAYGGDGGPAKEAVFDGPRDLTFDDKGNLFVADAGNHSVRRIDAVTGIITTVAGTGHFGFATDGGLATATKLTWPTGVALDKAGNLYIAESYNHRIRKVDAATGIITTVAGTGTKGYFGDGRLATEALLNSPGDVTLDKNGDLYIVDSDNHRIRKVDAATGVISTIAGKGTAGFSGDGELATNALLHYPTDIAIDKDGKIYIADAYNHRIRYICKTSSLPSATTAGVSTIDPRNNNTAVFAENCVLQAILQPSGTNPVSGIVYDSVWIEPTVPIVNGQSYVQRHYGITPQQNASTVTGTLTLYFTQADFTAYNAVPNHGPDLPVDAADVANNKANLLIKKRSGSSSDGTGRFDAYSGNKTDIKPTTVVWDSNLKAWKVTFNVSGFSGFFITSAYSTTTPTSPVPQQPSIIIFPNPVMQPTTLQIEAPENERFQCRIFDVFGSTIQSWNINVLKGHNTFPIDVSNLALGIYILQLRGTTSVKQLKFVKQ